MFEKKINPDYLKLAQVAYGGDYYLELKNYKLKKVVFNNSKIEVVVDSLLSKRGITDYYSYKNPNTGFAANLFKNKITGELVIAYRGTERPGLGENQNDVKSLMKDFMTDPMLSSRERSAASELNKTVQILLRENSSRMLWRAAFLFCLFAAQEKGAYVRCHRVRNKQIRRTTALRQTAAPPAWP